MVHIEGVVLKEICGVLCFCPPAPGEGGGDGAGGYLHDCEDLASTSMPATIGQFLCLKPLVCLDVNAHGIPAATCLRPNSLGLPRSSHNLEPET